MAFIYFCTHITHKNQALKISNGESVMVMEAVVSDTIAQKELAQEVVYFAQVRTNNQITIPKECMEAKNLKQGDVIAIAVLKIVDGTVTWMNLKSRLSGRGGETKNE